MDVNENKAMQVILFGNPGTGKSHYVKNVMLKELDVDPNSENCISTVFHPEYSYGDFFGKLLPYSIQGKIEYNYHIGHFLRALAQAYRNIIDKNNKHVVLVIDEINRGNSAAIFGTAFHLLDRDNNGWSDYNIDISVMEYDAVLAKMGVDIIPSYGESGRVISKDYEFLGEKYSESTIHRVLSSAPFYFGRNKIKIPSNLSIIATMNISDNSIYYMDTAFKRRWDWKFIGDNQLVTTEDKILFKDRVGWEEFVAKLNRFIRSNYIYVRKIEDKQIGYWFLSKDDIMLSDIECKVMFYVWDSVFTANKKPLTDLMGKSTADVLTFGDFTSLSSLFIERISGL